MQTKLNPIQIIEARFQIIKEMAKEVQSIMETRNKPNGEVVFNFEQMMSIMDDFKTIATIDNTLPIEDNWHGKFK